MSGPWEQTRQVLPAGAEETPVDLQSCSPIAVRPGGEAMAGCPR